MIPLNSYKLSLSPLFSLVTILLLKASFTSKRINFTFVTRRSKLNFTLHLLEIFIKFSVLITFVIYCQFSTIDSTYTIHSCRSFHDKISLNFVSLEKPVDRFFQTVKDVIHVTSRPFSHPMF